MGNVLRPAEGQAFKKYVAIVKRYQKLCLIPALAGGWIHDCSGLNGDTTMEQVSTTVSPPN